MKKTTVKIEDARNLLKDYLLRLAPDTNLNELEELIVQFTEDKFSKKEMLLEAGNHSDTVYGAHLLYKRRKGNHKLVYKRKYDVCCNLFHLNR